MLKSIFLNLSIPLLVALSACAYSESAPDSETQLKALQALTLDKFYFEQNDEENIFSDRLTVYKDAESRIRIIEIAELGEEFRYIKRAVYNDKGELIVFYAIETDNGGADGHLRITLADGKIIKKDTLKYSQPDVYKDFLTVQTAGKILITNMQKLQPVGKVVFRTPVKDSYAPIFSMNVNVRESANTAAKVVGQLNALDSVSILSIGKTETIGSFGNNSWYEIECWTDTLGTVLKGWVYGGFVSPVEVPVQ